MKIHGTAKGGALSKKDFGVAFSTAAAGCTTETVYEQTTTNDDINFDSDYTKIGVKYTAASNLGKLAKATFNLKKTGTPSGTVECHYFSGTTDTETSSDSYDISEFTTSYAEKEFTFSEENVISQNDIIAVVYTGSTQLNMAQNTGSISNWQYAFYDSSGDSWAALSRSPKGSIEACQT